MPVLWISLGILWALTVVMEFSLWVLFSRNIRSMLMPQELDESSHGFFTMGRVRALAITHTVLMLVILTSFLLWLW